TRARKVMKTHKQEFWNQRERKSFTKILPKSLESLKKYLLSAIRSLDKNDPINNKVYKSGLIFLREDIFNIYKKYESSEDLINKLKEQLESFKDEEKHIRILENGKYYLPDLEGVPLSHSWWRFSITRLSSEQIQELRER